MQLIKFARILNPHTAKISSKHLKEHQPPKSIANDIQKEWPLYVEIVDRLDVVDLNKFDLKHWWSVHKLKLPNMYKAARWILAVPCSTCDVERSFSKYKEILAPNRRCMNTDTVKWHNALYYNKKINVDQENDVDNEVDQDEEMLPLVLAEDEDD